MQTTDKKAQASLLNLVPEVFTALSYSLLSFCTFVDLFFYNPKQGRVEVTIGKEGHKFIEGPFTIFGEQILEQVSRGTVSLVSKS